MATLTVRNLEDHLKNRLRLGLALAPASTPGSRRSAASICRSSRASPCGCRRNWPRRWRWPNPAAGCGQAAVID
jgi:hypothetical protein